MNRMILTASLLTAAFGVTGCETTETFTPTSEVVSGADDLRFGTQSTTQSGNGLPFADDIVELESSEVDGFLPATVRMVQLTTGANTSPEFAYTSKLVGLSTEGEPTIRILINDDVVDMSAFGSMETVSEDGTVYRVTGSDPEIEALPLLITSFDPAAGAGGDIRFGAFILAPETNPDEIPQSSSTTYDVNVAGLVAVLDEAGAPVDFVDANGSGSLFVGFSGDGTLGGVVTISPVDYPVLRLDVGGGEFVGNGFSGIMGDTSPDCGPVPDCFGASEIGGIFTGVDASGVAGIMKIDETRPDGDSGVDRFVGVATFEGQQNPE